MESTRTGWLAGAATASFFQQEDSTRLAVRLLVPHQRLAVTVLFSDQSCKHAVVSHSTAHSSAQLDITLADATSLPPPGLLQQYRHMVSGNKLYHGRFCIGVSAQEWRATRKLVFEFTPLPTAFGEPIHLELNRRSVNSLDSAVPLLLITKSQAAHRMAQIIRRYPALTNQNEQTTNALSNMVFRMFGGAASPLLTEDIE